MDFIPLFLLAGLVVGIISIFILTYLHLCDHDRDDVNQLKRVGYSYDFFKSLVYAQQCVRCKKIRSFEIS